MQNNMWTNRKHRRKSTLLHLFHSSWIYMQPLTIWHKNSNYQQLSRHIDMTTMFYNHQIIHPPSLLNVIYLAHCTFEGLVTRLNQWNNLTTFQKLSYCISERGDFSTLITTIYQTHEVHKFVPSETESGSQTASCSSVDIRSECLTQSSTVFITSILLSGSLDAGLQVAICSSVAV